MKAISKIELLNNLENQVEQHLGTVTSKFQNLKADTLLKQAANGGWSIAQCVEHLNSYGRYYLPAIKKGLVEAKDSQTEVFKSTWLGSYFTNMMMPGAKAKKMKAPKNHNPPSMLDAAKVIAEFIEQQEVLISLLKTSRAKDVNKIRIPISISKLIKLKLGDTFGFLIAHNERHLQQALKHISENLYPADNTDFR